MQRAVIPAVAAAVLAASPAAAQLVTGDYMTLANHTSIEEMRLQYIREQTDKQKDASGAVKEVPETSIKSDGKLCDASVQQHSGYVKFTGSMDMTKSYFFWMFESKKDPKNAPLVIWLTGGPGCSSQMALLSENGPCSVDAKDPTKTIPNPHSWNNEANILWVDQPAGTGFSEGIYDFGEGGVQTDFYAFLQEFFKQPALKQYASHKLYLTGESYAGHYVPAIGYKIFQENEAIKNGTSKGMPINLVGLAVGNGLTDPAEQYKHYPQMALDGGKAQGGSLQKGVITNPFAQGLMKAGLVPCEAAIKQCDGGSKQGCVTAFTVCNYAESMPYQFTGMNVYDMRIKCAKPPLCYDFSQVETFLNNPAVQKEIGATGKWKSCNMMVNKLFVADFMKSFKYTVPPMLHAGIDILIYAGDVDYICNWLGNKAWTTQLAWDGGEQFGKANDDSYTFDAKKFCDSKDLDAEGSKKCLAMDGQKLGRLRSYKNFHFMQVYNAGHMVPMNQPEAADQMIRQFISGALPKPSEAAEAAQEVQEEKVLYI